MNVERRTVLQAGGLVAVGGIVAACSNGSSGAAATSAAASSAAPAASAASAAPAASSGGAISGAIAQVADIPVGGGVILPDQAVVVTQPTAGDIKAFSAICTHQGCLVSEVVDNEIVCPCHGSTFSATDGAVINGPAMSPLAAASVTVDGGSVVLNG